MKLGSATVYFISSLILISGCTKSKTVIGTDKNRFVMVTYKDVRPVFRDNCALVGCHLGEGARHELRLDTYEGILKGSAHDVITIAHHPEEGELMYRLEGIISPAMPLGKQLAPELIELIRLWIIDGLKRD